MFTEEVNRALVAAADLINTAEGPRSASHTPETLETVEDLRAFLRQRHAELQWPTSTANTAQLQKVRQLRSTLSRLWGSGTTPDEPHLQLINELLEGVGTKLIRSEAEGEPSISEAPIPVSSQIHHVMTATIAAALSHLVVAGEASRLRICHGEDCQAAIVDLTRNRSKMFCDFGNCANRAHVRAYRARRASRQGNAGDSSRRSTGAEDLSSSDSVSAAAEAFRDRVREELVDQEQR